MAQWLHFFRGGHIGVNVNSNPSAANNNSTGKETPAQIRKKYSTEQRININYKQYTQQYNKQNTHHPLEGIWSNGLYTVVVLQSKDTSQLLGVVLHADSIFWLPGQIKMHISKQKLNNTYATKYGMKDHSIENTQLQMVGNGGNFFTTGSGGNWQRLYPVSKYTAQDSLVLLISTPHPFVNRLSKNTMYLRIPSFNHAQKPFIDSVLQANDNAIRTSPNLIIDIRNGTGGSDFSYHSIMPYLYTNPIRHTGTREYATPLNAKAYDYYATLFADTAVKNSQLRTAAAMRKNIGKFLGSDTIHVSVDTLHQVLPNPKYVAIICNHINASADEQFIIYARQSKKVKIFGAPTAGMLDFSNLNFTNSPDGFFQLYYATDKSYRVPTFCIDDVGIQPDVYLDESIPEHLWIKYVQAYLEN